MTNYEKLQKVLTEIFQLDKAELDFGIYRILNQKRADVEMFLTQELPSQVRKILIENSQKGGIAIEAKLEATIQQLKELGVNPDTSKKVQQLKEEQKKAVSVDALEQDVFSHLANFFKRYYQGGDFISLRRYKKDVYAIPYEGEEVKLHWANHDQYYIKTSEYLKNYAFTIGEKTVHFRLKEASTEQNNNKTQKNEERRFALFTENPVTFSNNELNIYFTYEPHKKSVKQEELLKKALAVLVKKIPSNFAEVFSLKPTEKNKTRTLLEKHLNDYAAKNTFDYFIHKDLGGFLRRELDFYIKNEVLYIDDINTENEQAFGVQLSKIRALKQVAGKIILFLEQLENFQKKLWLKKKLVVRCDYCITLDRISENYYTEILKNRNQLEEWKNLFNVHIKTVADLKDEPYLVLDTQFFPEDFKDRLLSEFHDLDNEINGLLINSENFQALNFLREKLYNKIKCLYIDPPYNTNASEIVYKNGYKDSSWNGLIDNRLRMSFPLLSDNSLSCATIDDLELRNLNYLMHQIYGAENYQATICIRNNPSGRSTVKGFSINHEYGLFYSKNNDSVVLGRMPHTDAQTDRYDEVDKEGNAFEWENFRKNGTDSNRSDRPKQYFPFYFDKQKKRLRIPNMIFDEADKNWNLNDSLNTSEVALWPIDDNGVQKVWKFGKDRTNKLLDEFLVKQDNGSFRVYRKKYLNSSGSLPRTWWDDSKYSARDTGTRDLKKIFGSSDTFDFPKSVEAVMDSLRVCLGKQQGITLDYFSGSGTTGHAVIRLNREDGGNRKYILVEMGEYFNTVTKPRIQKVIYTDTWKDGRPQDKKGLSQMFRYLVLESYEDTLNNLQLKRTDQQGKLLSGNEKVHEQYLLQYMLDVESRGQLFNIKAFINPFNYQLNITENNALKPTKVDLVETFNYLIGLRVKRIQRAGHFKSVEGADSAGNRVLIIWRNLNETDNGDLERFVTKMDYNLRDGEFDMIYVNGDNKLGNLRAEEDGWKVLLIEEIFFTKMFEVKDI